MDVRKALHERSVSAPGRELKASSLRKYLAKRHTEFRLSNEVTLCYAEGYSALHMGPSELAKLYQESLWSLNATSQLTYLQSRARQSYFSKTTNI